MSLPQRHVIRRPAAAVAVPRVGAADFDDVATDPGTGRGWSVELDDEPRTVRPPARRHAGTGVADPAVETRPQRPLPRSPRPAPVAARPVAAHPVVEVEAPTRMARRSTPPPAWRDPLESVAGAGRASGASLARPLPPPPEVSRARPLPPQPEVSRARPLPAPEPSRAQPLPQARVVSSPSPSPAPAPAAPPSIDIPPELATPVYGLIRRLALQSELTAADRVLRVGLAELTDATVALSRFVGDDGQPWALGDQGEGGPGDAILAQIAAAGVQVANGHVLVQPIVAAGRTVALVVLNRNERLAPFGLVERAIALLVARECGGLLHQLLGAHADKQREAAADARSLFRPEALESHRSRGAEGVLINLSPRWVRRAYPIACAVVVVALGFAIFAKVPTYSTGPVVITVDGHDVTAPAQGTVDAIAINPGDRVEAGQELAHLYSVQEQAELAQAEQEYGNALTTFLVDGDDTAKQALAAASAKRDRSRAVVEARTVRAPEGGVVSDVRVRAGQNLMPGDRILTIVPEGAEPVVVALLPGQDRPRLRVGMTLQVELKGFIKPRERVTITEVGSEVLGPDDARRTLGTQFADLVGQSGAWVLVKARLPRRTFEAQHHTYHFHNGLRGTGEVRIESKPFLVTLIPALEKVLY